MTVLEQAVLGYLSRFCRGAAAARKVWKVGEDLKALGLSDATPRRVRDGVANLRTEGFPIVLTDGDSPRIYIEEPRRTRPRGGWSTGHRPRRSRRATSARPSAVETVLAGAEAACGQSVKDASVRRRATSARPGQGVLA